MAGDKRQAACFLAEHLLLTGKEKVAVVTFQERSSKVVVPFTRNESLLRKGLSTINPAGLTPLADGIMTALNLINNTRVRNPLLVLITDGIPNTPLWTMDAKSNKDGILSFRGRKNKSKQDNEQPDYFPQNARPLKDMSRGELINTEKTLTPSDY